MPGLSCIGGKYSWIIWLIIIFIILCVYFKLFGGYGSGSGSGGFCGCGFSSGSIFGGGYDPFY